MEVDSAYLRQRYSSMETDELIDLLQQGSLTDIALNVLHEVLDSRGISADERESMVNKKAGLQEGLANQEDVRDADQGIGGWLLLLIVGLVFLGPFGSIMNFKAELLNAEATNSQLLKDSTWEVFKFLMWSACMFFGVLSIYGGAGLAAKRTISVVKRAKLIIWIIGPIQIVFLFVVIPFAFGWIGMVNLGYVLVNLIFAILYALIWTAYLTGSKRVRATYIQP